ncbi:hypothetical protein Aab01nite_51790 [Paractinoplanes abujensis]|uniref:Uncharacterized protein n=2 Tax=Paractinoplanes abujensis TaxID=882441 RepID=A0A7W7CUW5_9ACTN|nr:hypothetical protein [Actinoplanes abujensis]MBB4693753.1 hypothetical protein [Actinoplanes abujensis]GID21589.1 hypothetical protein Aab01nite_51790 [Actinoplanes abujensis]
MAVLVVLGGADHPQPRLDIAPARREICPTALITRSDLEESKDVRSFTLAAATYGVAAVVSAVSAGFDTATGLQHGAEAVALLALAACVVLAGSAAPRLLVVFCLLLAARATIDLIASRTAMPAPAPEDLNGCPVETEATTAYWRGQLRYSQFGEVLRAGALACAIPIVRMRPGGRRRYAVTALLLVLPILYALFPFFSASDAAGLLAVAVPGLVSVALAAALVVVTAPRTAGGAGLIVGVALLALPAVFAVENLAGIYWQLPDPVDTAGVLCFSAVATPGAPPVQWSAAVTVVYLLLLSAPAVLAWSATRPDDAARSPAGPDKNAL